MGTKLKSTWYLPKQYYKVYKDDMIQNKIDKKQREQEDKKNVLLTEWTQKRFIYI